MIIIIQIHKTAEKNCCKTSTLCSLYIITFCFRYCFCLLAYQRFRSPLGKILINKRFRGTNQLKKTCASEMTVAKNSASHVYNTGSFHDIHIINNNNNTYNYIYENTLTNICMSAPMRFSFLFFFHSTSDGLT
jgi:hypothetical protein